MRGLGPGRLATVFVILGLSTAATQGQVSDSISLPLQQTQYDLSQDGRSFLLQEAARASFFMLGELHGEREIPALIRSLWPALWDEGYRHVAAEVSPLAANRLEFGGSSVPILGLWTQPEATFVASFKRDRTAVLWGCDIEEAQPQLLIRELAAVNPDSKELQAAVDTVKSGYQRKMAASLLKSVQAAGAVKDLQIGGASLQDSLVETLDVESARFAGSALDASVRRERVLKDHFHDYWIQAGKPKVFLRFGRNHLHRGIDRRGVSTLGNFVTELAAAESLHAFNVAAFAGGGKIRLGLLSDLDERGDDPAFAHLASIARYPATVFDLRPLRQPLHRLPPGKRSAIEASLMYWADSYDAMIFYREVTPL
jgi:hypothetical protein